MSHEGAYGAVTVQKENNRLRLSAFREHAAEAAAGCANQLAREAIGLYNYNGTEYSVRTAGALTKSVTVYTRTGECLLDTGAVYDRVLAVLLDSLEELERHAVSAGLLDEEQKEASE